MIYSWQWDGVAPFDEVVNWCAEHLSDKTWFSSRFETLTFYNEADYVAFKLRWIK